MRRLAVIIITTRTRHSRRWFKGPTDGTLSDSGASRPSTKPGRSPWSGYKVVGIVFNLRSCRGPAKQCWQTRRCVVTATRAIDQRVVQRCVEMVSPTSSMAPAIRSLSPNLTRQGRQRPRCARTFIRLPPSFAANTLSPSGAQGGVLLKEGDGTKFESEPVGNRGTDGGLVSGSLPGWSLQKDAMSNS